jgi:hypothetical protein
MVGVPVVDERFVDFVADRRICTLETRYSKAMGAPHRDMA